MAKRDEGTRQVEKQPNSPRPGTPQAELTARDEDLERTRLSTSDEDVGQDRIDHKGVTAKGDQAEVKLHAKPLSDEE